MHANKVGRQNQMVMANDSVLLVDILLVKDHFIAQYLLLLRSSLGYSKYLRKSHRRYIHASALATSAKVPPIYSK